jgi:hypothetical protein
MSYDSTKGSVYLFGGFDGNPRSEMWEYTGTNARWNLRSSSGPGPRLRHAMVYDPVRDVTLMFGGQDTSSVDGVFSNDFWQWEATPRRWTQITAPPPPARYLHAMAFDTTRGVALLFGGLAVGYGYVGDTWAWDGTAWTQQASNPEPSPRARTRWPSTGARGMAVLFGGYDGTFNRETWEWDGSQWAERAASFIVPRAPALGTRGFLVIQDGQHALEALRFQLGADSSGLRASWSSSR